MIFSTTKSRRLKLRSTPFPSTWREILQRRFPLLACLFLEDQRELEGHIQVFLAGNQFEGCDGLVITDENHVQWTDHTPVFEKVKDDLPADAQSLLNSLFSALSDSTNVPPLTDFPAWSDAQ